jgi:thiol-disulfide isomerase/thioredoxin
VSNTWIRAGAAATAVLLGVGVVLGLTLGRNGLTGAQSAALQGGGIAADGPAAPELTGIAGWDNSPPLTLAALRGKVVLIDFWTYSCINCQRTIPFLQQWWSRYRGMGLVIIGVHSPEFAFERDAGNVRRAAGELGVTWPVALDSGMATWNAYGNQYWPAEYLIDKRGKIRHTHFGEGDYDVTERAIQQLLSEGGARVTAPLASADPGIGPDAANQTPETYVGSERGDGSVTLTGAWKLQPEYAEHTAAAAPGADWAELPFKARKVYVVAGVGAAPTTLRITLDGRDPRPSEVPAGVRFDAAGHAFVPVDHQDLYPVISLPDFGAHTLRVSPDAAGFQLYTFTFGS